jgi:hypothetical protein
MQAGELIVTGTNSIVIPLDNFPAEVHIHFKDEGRGPVPCDPGDVDFLQYTVHNTVQNGITLVISWSVSSVREIKWTISY